MLSHRRGLTKRLFERIGVEELDAPSFEGFDADGGDLIGDRGLEWSETGGQQAGEHLALAFLAAFPQTLPYSPYRSTPRTNIRSSNIRSQAPIRRRAASSISSGLAFISGIHG